MKERLIFLLLAPSVSVLALVMLLVVRPLRAEFPALEVAGGPLGLPGNLADMSWYPLFSYQEIVPPGGAAAL